MNSILGPLKWCLAAAFAFLAVWGFHWVVASAFFAIIDGNLLVIGSLIATIALVAGLRMVPARWWPKMDNGLRGGERASWTPREELSPEAAKLRSLMKREAEPAFLLVRSNKRGFSRVGGQPDLPADFHWPTEDDGPLHFLMQIDFSELRWGRAKRSDWLPGEGRLWVFLRFDSAERKDLLQLQYASRDVPLVRTVQPAGVPTYPELAVDFHRFRAAPSEDWLGPRAEPLRNDDGDSLQEEAGGYTFPSFGAVAHYVGGYPQEIQPAWLPMEAERSLRDTGSPWRVSLDGDENFSQDEQDAARDWRMLLQVDTDRRMKGSWGDGQIYVLIRREDAKRLDFSKTISICQFA